MLYPGDAEAAEEPILGDPYARALYNVSSRLPPPLLRITGRPADARAMGYNASIQQVADALSLGTQTALTGNQ